MKLYNTPSGGRQETKLDSNNLVEFLNHLNIFYGHGRSLNKHFVSQARFRVEMQLIIYPLETCQSLSIYLIECVGESDVRVCDVR